MTFWDHLDALRGTLLRMMAATVLVAIVLFCFKEPLFDLVLAPSRSTFVSYRMMGAEPMDVTLINTGLTRQFAVHIHIALYAALVITLPYLLYEVFRFLAPGLYRTERRYVSAVMCSGTLMFAFGLVLAYYVVFPLSLRFLAGYRVSADVPNMITLDSYTDTMLTLGLMMGLVSELPVAMWLAGRLGIVHRGMLQQYRRHVIVALLVLAAIVTPTTDAVTLVVVTLPLVLLYEMGIWLTPNARCL